LAEEKSTYLWLLFETLVGIGNDLLMIQKIKFTGKDRAEFYPVLKKRVDAYFKDNNISTHANGLMRFKIVLYLTMIFGSLITLLVAPLPIWAVYLLFVNIGLFSAFSGLGICHDAIHGSLFASSKWNTVFSWLFNLVGAFDYTWSIMHNKAHHTYTNIEGADEDLQSVPFLRMSPHQKLRKVHRIQHWLALPTYGLATLAWVFIKDYKKMSQDHIGGIATPSHPRKQWIRLFVGKALYYTIFIALPFIFIQAPWYHILGAFLVAHYFEGFTLAVVFMLAHVVEETHFPMPDDAGIVPSAWAVHQMYTTANFAINNPVVCFFCGGLNFQVEHHLFPLINHVHFPAISKITRETAAEYGVPYFAHPTMFGALRSHLRLLKRFGREKGDAHPVVVGLEQARVTA
jgi:linoleoyl-CoA desaturase